MNLIDARTVDPADRRAQRIALTASGRSTLRALRIRVADRERELLGGLDELQRSSLIALLGRAEVSLTRCLHRHRVDDLRAIDR